MEYSGNIVHILGVGSFPLDDGGQCDNLVKVMPGSLDILHQAFHLILEVVHQLAHHRANLLPFVEVVGVGEQVALQLVILAGDSAQGSNDVVVVKVAGVDGLQEVLRRADLVFLQKGSGFQGRGALGEGDLYTSRVWLPPARC